MRLIVLPQALRVITPPLGNQYSNLLKNTSIALAVGYSDLLSVVSTSVNQTFRPIELMLLVAGFFLVVNMLISALVNWPEREAENTVPPVRVSDSAPR